MPDWLGGLLALAALVGFIGFAFRQGTKVKPAAIGMKRGAVTTARMTAAAPAITEPNIRAARAA